MRQTSNVPLMAWWLGGLATGAPLAFLLGLACGIAARGSLTDALADWHGALVEKTNEIERGL